ncbi:MAG: 4Fe-4S dicluster domain-containing protein [Bacteroidales bacterium]|nr:4Fe-4S dicluster domain-containing protein [Bacteroidales bacterium]
MKPFGFKIATTHTIIVDDKPLDTLSPISGQVPTFRRCMNCGGCTATCSAAHFTQFNIRKIHNLYRWHQIELPKKELEKCMLCGKCTLVCPRDVNLRSLIIYMRRNIDALKKKEEGEQ